MSRMCRAIAISTFLSIGITTAATSARSPYDSLYQRPGRLVDVGGYRLNLVCLGSGAPTVVFDSGLEDWAPA